MVYSSKIAALLALTTAALSQDDPVSAPPIEKYDDRVDRLRCGEYATMSSDDHGKILRDQYDQSLLDPSKTVELPAGSRCVKVDERIEKYGCWRVCRHADTPFNVAQSFPLQEVVKYADMIQTSCAYHDYDKLDWYDYRWRPKGLKPGVFSGEVWLWNGGDIPNYSIHVGYCTAKEDGPGTRKVYTIDPVQWWQDFYWRYYCGLESYDKGWVEKTGELLGETAHDVTEKCRQRHGGYDPAVVEDEWPGYRYDLFVDNDMEPPADAKQAE